MYEIIGIQVAQQPPRLDTITDYYFQGRNGETSQWMTKLQGVAYVRQNPSTVYVSGGGSSAFVDVVESNVPYLRTRADGTQSDNLLSLPVY
ncbi:DUF3892 domain-containing protein [Agreia bicolorata]|uniref:DUF3892 domain-containing protein n=1 Tax=Agreia bicolorata TaxID=110935 RepID=UPI0009FDBC17